MASPPDQDAGKKKVRTAAQHIVKSLATSKNAADDMIRILSGFDNRFTDLFPPNSSDEPALASSTADSTVAAAVHPTDGGGGGDDDAVERPGLSASADVPDAQKVNPSDDEVLQRYAVANLEMTEDEVEVVSVVDDMNVRFAALDIRHEVQRENLFPSDQGQDGGKTLRDTAAEVLGGERVEMANGVEAGDVDSLKQVVSDEEKRDLTATASSRVEELIVNAIGVIEVFLSSDVVHSAIYDEGGKDGLPSEKFTAAVRDLLMALADQNLQPGLRARGEAEVQLAMARLEDEFRHLLVRDSAAVVASEDLHFSFLRRFSVSVPSFHVSSVPSFHVSADLDSPAVAGAGAAAVEDDAVNGLFISEDQLSTYVISPGLVSKLHEIADLMLLAGYEQELCQVFGDVRREALLECLAALGLENMSIEEVQRVEWVALDGKMKRWIQILKTVVRGLLAEERRACDQIFAASEMIRDECFAEASKGCVLQLLNFGDAIAIGKRSSQKLFRILGIYEALSDVLPDLVLLFAGGVKALIKEEAEGILARLADAIRGTVAEFSCEIQGEPVRRAVVGGDIHPATRYVMNYVWLLSDYSRTLNSLLDFDMSDRDPSSDNPNITPLGHCVFMLLTHLQAKIDEKARLYEDEGLQNVFKMNNLLYIVQKVRDSELQKLLGDDWIRKCRGQIRRCSMSYLRASWNRVVACLRDDGMSSSGSSGAALKAALREKLKNFNLTFDELYRMQTTWKVPDDQLKEELKISVSEMVLPAYRAFVGRYRSHLEGGRIPTKYIKYSPEELETLVDGLFEGRRNA